MALSWAANKRDYDEVLPDEFREKFGRNHYTFAVRNVGENLDNWRLGQRANRPLQFIFDFVSEPKQKREIEDAMAQAEWVAKRQGRPGDFEHYAFCRRKAFAGLQCADAIGWICYQSALLQFRGKPLPMLAQEGWSGLIGDQWLRVGTASREKLERWVSHEKQHGNAMRNFKQWESARR